MFPPPPPPPTETCFARSGSRWRPSGKKMAPALNGQKNHHTSLVYTLRLHFAEESKQCYPDSDDQTKRGKNVKRDKVWKMGSGFLPEIHTFACARSAMPTQRSPFHTHLSHDEGSEEPNRKRRGLPNFSRPGVLSDCHFFHRQSVNPQQTPWTRN